MPASSQELFDYFRDEMIDRAGGQSADDLCRKCNGRGTRSYPSTSTWRGGIGGQAFTGDVCDGCWGSGNRHRPWPSHREFYEMKRRLATEETSR